MARRKGRKTRSDQEWITSIDPNRCFVSDTEQAPTRTTMAPLFLFRHAHHRHHHGLLTFDVALLALLLFCLEDSSSSSSLAHGLQFGTTASPQRIGRVAAGDSGLAISELGVGTWQWGNKVLWSYEPDQDDEIYEAYKVVRDAGVTVFDTADSYGTLALNGTNAFTYHSMHRDGEIGEHASFRLTLFCCFV
jgi:hypothetical protein